VKNTSHISKWSTVESLQTVVNSCYIEDKYFLHVRKLDSLLDSSVGNRCNIDSSDVKRVADVSYGLFMAPSGAGMPIS
jgi:hypothetical protein